MPIKFIGIVAYSSPSNASVFTHAVPCSTESKWRYFTKLSICIIVCRIFCLLTLKTDHHLPIPTDQQYHVYFSVATLHPTGHVTKIFWSH